MALCGRADIPHIILLLVWVIVNVGLFIEKFINLSSKSEYFYLRYIVGSYLPLAKASASCIKFNCALILILVCRNSLKFFRNVFVQFPEPFGRSSRRVLDTHVSYHKWIARAIIFFTFIHVLAHVFNVERLSQGHNSKNNTKMFLSQFPDSFPVVPDDYILNPVRSATNPVVVIFTTWIGVTGLTMTLALILIWTSAFRIVRLYAHEAFFYTHKLYWVFFVGLVVHGPFGIGLDFIRQQTNVGKHKPMVCVKKIEEWDKKNVKDCPLPTFASTTADTWKWVVPSLILFAIEIAIRKLRTWHPVVVTKIVFHPSNVLELQMTKRRKMVRGVEKAETLVMDPGQYILLKCPQISKMEWHPFTLTSAPGDDYFSVHIRKVGDWTTSLSELCGTADGANQVVPLQDAPHLFVDGPYGAASQEWFSYEASVFVGAGIGVTPFASVLKHIYNELRQGHTLYVKVVHFYFITPDIKSFEWFRDLLHDLEQQGRGVSQYGGRKQDLLTFHIFLTRGWDAKRVKSIMKKEEEEIYCQFSGLNHRTEFGRPPWKDELKRIHDAQESNTRIGVFLCGPKPLADQLKAACHEVNAMSVTGSRLYLNKEHF